MLLPEWMLQLLQALLLLGRRLDLTLVACCDRINIQVGKELVLFIWHLRVSRQCSTRC